MFLLDDNQFIFFSLLIVFLSMIFYAIEKFSMVFKSIVILTFLLIFFSIFPYKNQDGINLLNPQTILNGFSNTSLITVISLLILGQGVVQTRVLNGFITNFLGFFSNNTKIIIFVTLFIVLFLSAFINNTPVVIIFIPIIQGIVKNLDYSMSKFLMPLSFAAILGGMITIVGSSTNLLVSNSLYNYAKIEISFFEFALPGSVIAIAGLFYLIFFSKILLVDRSPISNQLVDDSKNSFITKIVLNQGSFLIGKAIKDSNLKELGQVKILMIQRGEHAEHAPFYGFILEEGDILNIDVTVILDGWHGDTSRMFPVGKVNGKSQRLMDCTYESMLRGINVISPNKKLGDIGYAIQSYAEENNFSVVRDFCGHGLGKMFHEFPNILHYGEPNTGEQMSAGMIFTVEPMINVGKYDVRMLGDGWTAVTKDKSLSAQYEHSVGVTSDGVEIFTKSPAGLDKP